jgi:exodeoxyribonuclease III
MRIISLNVNGIRSAASKGFFAWAARQRADIFCVQEIKAQAADLTAELSRIGRLTGHFHHAEKKGYSGVGLYLKTAPSTLSHGLKIPEIDAEGRYLAANYGKLTVVSLYLPSGSSGPERQEAKFRFMQHFFPRLQKLRQSGQEVILCGDWNIAHQEIDLKNWRSNQKNSGFLPEERRWLSEVLQQLGFVDVFRRLDPRPEQYTWWSNRAQAYANNVGWRIDYQIATPGIAAKARAARIYKDERFSDHAPLIIDYDFAM